MNPRALIQFFGTPSGKLLGFLVLMFVALAFARGCRRTTEARVAHAPPTATNAPVVDSFRHTISPIGAAALPVVTNLATNASVMAPLTIYADLGPEPEAISHYAPYGSLIPCCLVQAIESDDAETPIIALTTDDLCHLGNVILPRDSLVHGRLQRGRSRDRVHSESSWTLVWPTGEQLTVSGMALNQDRLPAGGWGPDDGVAGIKGRLVRTDHWTDLKVFAATFLSGAAQAFEERQTTALGSAVLPHAKNAALQGASEVLNRYAAQVVEQLQKEAYVVKIPAAKTLYLYVTQVIDRQQARVGQTMRSAPPLTSTAKVP